MVELSVAGAGSSPLQAWILRSQKEILALQAGNRRPGSSEPREERSERPWPSLD
jgi:hypothetical protein